MPSRIVADREGLFAKRSVHGARGSTFNAGLAAMGGSEVRAPWITYASASCPATNTFINSGGQAIRCRVARAAAPPRRPAGHHLRC